jgi:hypothetical protein
VVPAARVRFGGGEAHQRRLAGGGGHRHRRRRVDPAADLQASRLTRIRNTRETAAPAVLA